LRVRSYRKKHNKRLASFLNNIAADSVVGVLEVLEVVVVIVVVFSQPMVAPLVAATAANLVCLVDVLVRKEEE
jgi:hypothetical protein